MQNCVKELPLLSSRLGKVKAQSELFQVNAIVESNLKDTTYIRGIMEMRTNYNNGTIYESYKLTHSKLEKSQSNSDTIVTFTVRPH